MNDRIKELELRLDNQLNLLETVADEEERAEILSVVFELTKQIENIERSTVYREG